MAKILLVEDDLNVGEKLKEWFAVEGGHIFEWVTSAEDALQLLNTFGFDVLLLDWNLPAQTGLDVCKQYRKSGGRGKVIFLTGQSDIENKEQGLHYGGDDYLVKPFDCRELSARIRSVLRRPDQGPIIDRLIIGDMSLDPRSRTVTAGDKSIQLMPKEAQLLEFLMKHPDQSYRSNELSKAVWPTGNELDANTVRSWVRNLRVKLTSIGKENFIKTVAGSGYQASGD